MIWTESGVVSYAFLKMMRLLHALILTWFLLPGTAVLLRAGDVEFFEKKIRPVLAEKCYKCHSTKSEKLKGSLLLDHREHMLTGGETGAAIVPGDAESSLLIESIRYGNEDLQMPPKEKLSAEIVADFAKWIDEGATWPDEPVPQREGGGGEEAFDLQKRFEEHWSWRDFSNSEPPAVTNPDWAKSPVDQFILAKLEENGLRPAEEADRSIWFRRVHFDLVGLPPTREQWGEFLSDQSPQAKENAVDRLLDSPHFGEKWARHWMDLVRYAETYGHEFDYPIAGATEYRDYLIRAFNNDVPYDQFVKEHIAGDLLPEPRRNPEKGFNESILGTGFWYFHEATHAPTDVLANEADIMDNQIDVFGKSFLGLTVSCARCHDHKFDAISTKDYYAMTAYLHASARQEVVIDENRLREKTAADLIAKKREADALFKHPVQKAQVSAPLREDETIFEDFEGGALPDGWSTTGEAFSAASGGGIRFQSKAPVARLGVVDSGLLGKKQVGILRSPTFTIETDFIHILTKSEKSHIRLIIDNYQMARFSALLFKGTLHNNLDTKGGFAWKSLSGNLNKYRGHKAYLEFIDPENGEILVDEIRFSAHPKPPAVPEGRAKPVNQNLPAPVPALVKEGEGIANRLPAPRYAVAMAEGSPETANVYVRGSHRSLGDEVPARFLEALGGATGDRLALADHVAAADNPLTARVLVNRIWHHLFGQGIVPTVDDFGPMGRLPSHPELLDYLAEDFVTNKDWSMKQLIGELVLSSTYGQSSKPHPDLSAGMLAEIDPANGLLHRMRVKRLTGEAVRDSILAVSGRLDPQLFGASVPTHRTEFMTGRGGKKSGPLDGGGRRSIYGAVYRNFLSPFMLTFDVPSPFGPKGKRSISNVPAQALVLMNDPFVLEQSKLWGRRIVEEYSTDAERIDAMFLDALGRKPDSNERSRIESYLSAGSSGNQEEIWASLAHVVLNMKEFIFIP